MLHCVVGACGVRACARVPVRVRTRTHTGLERREELSNTPAIIAGISPDLLCDLAQALYLSGLHWYPVSSKGLGRGSPRLVLAARAGGGSAIHRERSDQGRRNVKKNVKHLRSRRRECFDSKEMAGDLGKLWPFGME